MEDVLADRVPVRLRRPPRLLRLTSDERLVALVRDGDEGAFEALYDRHHAAILGFCRHMLGTREEAEDAVQHTFLAAFRDLVGSEKAIDLRPWLFAIARNRCLSLLRARRMHVAIELAEPSTDGLAATVERREDLRELLADLACLPEDQRAALLLAELGALDHAGIAAVLDCPREKVKALVFQARTSLAASREARATPCQDIRVELATASGAALRRGPLRRHLRSCDGCRAFKAEVATQHKLLALALPVVPGVALKASVLGGGGAATAGATGVPASGTLGGVLGTLASTGAGKVVVSLAVVGAVAGSGALTKKLEQPGSLPAAPAAPTRSQADLHGASPPSIAGGAPARHGASTPAHSIRPMRMSTPFSGALSPPVPPFGAEQALHIVAPSHVAIPAPVAGDSEAGPAPLPATHVPDARPVPGTGEVRHHETSAPEQGGVPPQHAKGTQQRSQTPPGQSDTAPGHSQVPPGHSQTAPGHSDTAPGHSQAPPSQTAPGHSDTAPGHTEIPPAHGGSAPGNTQTPPGLSKASQGQGNTRPTQSGGVHSAQGSAGGSSLSGGPPSGDGAQSQGQPNESYGQSGVSHGQSGMSHGRDG